MKIIIPFGEECYTSQSIDVKFSQLEIRKLAFPFDYVGHAYIESIFDNINDLMNNTDNNFCNKNDFEIKLFNDKYFICHKKYNFKYWHDISSINNYIEDEDFKIFIEKYNRRYNRLKEYLTNNESIFIYSVNHFDNIKSKIFKENEIIKIFNLLNKYNKNIKFIAVNFAKEPYTLGNLIFINLPVNFDLNFFESKAEFTKNLYEFTKKTFI